MTTQIYRSEETGTILRDYVCAKCWGHVLGRHAEDRMTEIYCPICGEDQGLVTAKYVEMRRAEDKVDNAEARYNLREYFPSEHKGKSAEQLIEELGFRKE